MAKQEKLYTVKELSQELNVSVQRVHQLIEKHIIVKGLTLTDYINYVPKKSYRKSTLKLLKSKQQQFSKFNKFHK